MIDNLEKDTNISRYWEEILIHERHNCIFLQIGTVCFEYFTPCCSLFTTDRKL